jgi:ribulose 1,5-bisphosphate synthetase/thiazole synthase
MSSGGSPGYVAEPAKRVPVAYEVDVAVAGAGIAGLFAALAAARQGARTLLLDRFGAPGGNIGPAMVVAGGIYNEAEGTLVGGLAGIPRELIERLEALRGTPRSNYADESNIVSYLGLKMAEEAGVELLLAVWAADPIVEDGRVAGLFVETKSGRVAARARVVVDATGDADVALRAGVPVISALAPDPSFAPLVRPHLLDGEYAVWNDTGIFYLVAQVDFAAHGRLAAGRVALSEEERAWLREHGVAGYPAALVPALRRAWERGEFRPSWDVEPRVHLASPGQFLDYGGGLAGGRVNVRGEIRRNDARQYSRLEAALRTQAFETVRFFRRHAAGFEQAYLLFVAPYFGARGGPFIDGEYIVSPAEAYTGARFDDVLFRNIHEGQKVHGGEPSGFDAPYRMLLPKGLDGLLVTGRGAAYLRRGHDPTGMRARPSIMALGQATGTAAAMAARAGGSTRRLDVKALQRELLRQGFYLGEAARLQELGLS